MSKASKIPTFHSVQEEAEFWDTHSPLDHLDELEPVEVTFAPDAFRKGSGSGGKVTVTLPAETIATLRALARSQGVGSTTLVRRWILERLREAYNPPSSKARDANRS